MPVEEEVVVLYTGMRGYLDKLAVHDVGRFEQEVLRLFRGKHKDVLELIRTGGVLTSEIDGKLKSILDEFAEAFV